MLDRYAEATASLNAYTERQVALLRSYLALTVVYPFIVLLIFIFLGLGLKFSPDTLLRLAIASLCGQLVTSACVVYVLKRTTRRLADPLGRKSKPPPQISEVGCGDPKTPLWESVEGTSKVLGTECPRIFALYRERSVRAFTFEDEGGHAIVVSQGATMLLESDPEIGRAIIAHEICHIHQRDWNLLSTADHETQFLVQIAPVLNVIWAMSSSIIGVIATAAVIVPPLVISTHLRDSVVFSRRLAEIVADMGSCAVVGKHAALVMHSAAVTHDTQGCDSELDRHLYAAHIAQLPSICIVHSNCEPKMTKIESPANFKWNG